MEIGKGVGVAPGVGPLKVAVGPTNASELLPAVELGDGESVVVDGSGGGCRVAGPMAIAVPERIVVARAVARPAANTRCLNSILKSSRRELDSFARSGHARSGPRTQQGKGGPRRRLGWWNGDRETRNGRRPPPGWRSEVGARIGKAPQVRSIKGGGDLG